MWALPLTSPPPPHGQGWAQGSMIKAPLLNNNTLLLHFVPCPSHLHHRHCHHHHHHALQWLAYLQSQARLTLLSAGFSLAFGSMFAKTYRVHRIFTYSGIGLCKDKILQDSKLILLVCALLIIDGLVVTLWVVTDPLDRHLSNLTLEISAIDRSVVYQPQVSRAA